MSIGQTSESLASLDQLQEFYREVYPCDELALEQIDNLEYDIVIRNNRTEDIRFSTNTNFSEKPVDEFVENGEPDIPTLTDIYREEAQNPATRAVEFSPEARTMSEEQQDLWYGFTDSSEDVLDPQICLRPNTYDCLYLFDVSL